MRRPGFGALGVLAVGAGGMLLMRRMVPRMVPRMCRRMEQMMEKLPEDAPPRRMFVTMSAIREQNERILALLEEHVRHHASRQQAGAPV